MSAEEQVDRLWKHIDRQRAQIHELRELRAGDAQRLAAVEDNTARLMSQLGQIQGAQTAHHASLIAELNKLETGQARIQTGYRVLAWVTGVLVVGGGGLVLAAIALF